MAAYLYGGREKYEDMGDFAKYLSFAIGKCPDLPKLCQTEIFRLSERLLFVKQQNCLLNWDFVKVLPN